MFATCSYAVIVKGYRGYCIQLTLEISRTFLTSTMKVCTAADFYSHYIESVPRTCSSSNCGFLHSLTLSIT